MPLLKRKPFALSEPPEEMEPHMLVYQVRFTKEIFCDYREYLNRINFYRQRVWTCKSTGKVNLTYEEALVSEKHAAEKVQKLPKELMAPALQIINFSMLPLKDLADTIATKLQDRLYVDLELYGKKDGGEFSCKIVEVLEEGEKIQYKVDWLDNNKDTTESTIVNGEDLVRKKFPYSRNVLKSFVRESTYRYAPWVIHEELALKHGVSTDPPEEMRDIVSYQDGLVVRNRKKRKKGKDTDKDDDKEGEFIKYPIDDLLVQPCEDDPIFTDRPSPSTDFNVPMDCVGDLLTVWDFCSSFGRLLRLWPFSLEDFENAVCHKDSNLVLIVESHMVLLQLLINDNGGFYLALQERKRKLKITLMKWTEYLCDFIDMINIPELCTATPTIKRGHYGLLDAQAKLRILCELVNQALETARVRRKLDEYIEKQLVLGATRRGAALEEGKKRREEKERSKIGSDGNKVIDAHNSDSPCCDPPVSASNNNHCGQNGDVAKKENGEASSPQQNGAMEKSDKNYVDAASKKSGKKLKTEPVMENGEDHSSNGDKEAPAEQMNGNKEEVQELLNGDKEEAKDKSSKDQRVEAISKEHFEREMEKLFVRTNSLGRDRDYNRYWWFRRDGRIFVESPDCKQWGYYNTKEELDALMGSLNCKGEREKALHGQLEKFYDRICLELQKNSKELAHEIEVEDAILRRSTRVRAPPRKNPANAFMRYVNKWKD